jgi:hypothetical protein
MKLQVRLAATLRASPRMTSGCTLQTSPACSGVYSASSFSRSSSKAGVTFTSLPSASRAL